MDNIDPRLAAHAASFWGWSDDEAEAEVAAAPAPVHDKSGREVAVPGRHVVDDMRSDDEEFDGSDDDSMDEDTDDEAEVNAVTASLTATKPAAVRKPAPQVVVFEDPTKAKAGGNLYEFKKFMSSKVATVTKTAPPPPPLTSEEAVEEAELNMQDRELDDLIKTSKLIEEFAADELVGRDRRKYQMYKLEELGMKGKKAKMPEKERHQIRTRDATLERKALSRIEELGLDTRAVKNGLTTARALARNVSDKKATSFDKVISFAEFGKKKAPSNKPVKKRDRGIKGAAVGRFKDGMLTLSKRDIERVQSSSASTKAKAKGKGSKGGKR
ncbi:hypothetical protein H9P43_004514 [Blastocladiella emersonii ATCC 22665]|nr:hypothetical protein H9P43_004514 [Blastocladiella emersonii ATCC 22665]